MFDAKNYIGQQVEEAKQVLSGKRAITAVSGGVDSAVAAIIASRAIGDNLLAVTVDTGYMRYVTSERVPESPYITRLLQGLGVNIQLENAQDEFYEALKGVSEPEKKRKIIGAKFIDVFQRAASGIGAEYLVQGTIAPDWIESGGGMRDTIKSHHNVGGLPEKMGLKLFEPNRELYKDEVREVAQELGLPREIYRRQPFPGPGLAIRILGAPPTKENAEVARAADWIWCQNIDQAIQSGQIPDREAQYFAAYAPNWPVVGVHGDVRSYSGLALLRYITTVDYMSAAFGKLPWDVVERASIQITNELKDNVTGCVYDVSHKPPRTVEFE